MKEDLTAAMTRLAVLAKYWGGKLQRPTPTWWRVEPKFPISPAPFSSHNLAIDWTRKVIFAARDAMPGHVIHEFGHVFADRRPPDDSKEFDWFGWEYRLSLLVGARQNWMICSSDYAVEADGGEFGELQTSQQRRLLSERVAHATKLGLVVNGVPVAVR